MSKIAVDVVLLPPEEILELCIKLNAECNAAGKAKGQLGKKDFVPHISLAIGAVQTKDLPAIFSSQSKTAHRWSIDQRHVRFAQGGFLGPCSFQQSDFISKPLVNTPVERADSRKDD